MDYPDNLALFELLLKLLINTVQILEKKTEKKYLAKHC